MNNSGGHALVTGASRGIGAAIAVGLAADGFDILLNYRRDDAAAESVADNVRRAGRVCTLLKFDVCDAAAVDAALDEVLSGCTPEVLVNNAGFACDGLMAMMNDAAWRGVLEVHLDGFFNVTRRILPAMMRKRRGRIINIASTSGETGVGGQVNYSAAKAGLIGATKALAKEVARRNILVNAVSPGFIDTDMTSELPREQLQNMVPLKRFGTADEVAHGVRFLCSSQAAYITGQVLSINGGVYM
ncbi:3-oxoacyl-ACP reductase FabG [Nitratidesulfovibrio vulgaris]|uniref:3-oxoacyl-ACP reductase FabG n=1 Tax=Nitratidesulfovibrio vulgaris TaxID=881 RepID=UPI0023014FF3|nr:3-oxoacyl-ACP reductase FabG [Nitratidesulfovibrio vulgaris]WCB47063.1 3-oxoacyl-ACP reductase FabG [Nitratidesulfovibrio vulgaris]